MTVKANSITSSHSTQHKSVHKCPAPIDVIAFEQSSPPPINYLENFTKAAERISTSGN